MRRSSSLRCQGAWRCPRAAAVGRSGGDDRAIARCAQPLLAAVRATPPLLLIRRMRVCPSDVRNAVIVGWRQRRGPISSRGKPLLYVHCEQGIRRQPFRLVSGKLPGTAPSHTHRRFRSSRIRSRTTSSRVNEGGQQWPESLKLVIAFDGSM